MPRFTVNQQLPLPALIIAIVLIILLLPFIVCISIIAIIYALITKRKINKMFKDLAQRGNRENPPSNNEEGRIIDHDRL